MIRHAPLEFPLAEGEGLKLNIIKCQTILFGMLHKIVQSLCIPYASNIQFISRGCQKCSKAVTDTFSRSALYVHYLIKQFKNQDFVLYWKSSNIHTEIHFFWDVCTISRSIVHPGIGLESIERKV